MAHAPGPHAFTFLFLTVLLDMIGFGIIIPVLPGLVMDLTGEPVSGAVRYGGALLFLFALMQFIFAPVMGNLSDRFGRRPVILLCLVTFGLDYLIMGFAGSIWWLFVGRTLSGISGATYATANAYIADITPEDQRAKRFGIMGAAFGLGFVLGPAIGGIVGDWLGTRAPFFLAAGLSFANLVYGFFVLPETLGTDKRRPFRLARANPIGAFQAMRPYPLVIGLLGTLVFYQIAHDANPSTWSYYTIEKFGWGPKEIGWSLGFVGFLMAFVQGVLVGRIVPRLGERRTAILGLGFAAVGFTGFGLAANGFMLYAFMLPFALMGLVMPSLRAIMSAHIPADAQGELSGAMSSLFSLTTIFAPLLMTQVFGFFTAPDAPVQFPGAPFVLAGVLVLTALVLVTRIMRRHPD